jgi:hypothetical protein
MSGVLYADVDDLQATISRLRRAESRPGTGFSIATNGW